MPAPDDLHNGARATIREVMALVEASRKEIIAEIEKLEIKTEARAATHEIRHSEEAKTHIEEHKSDRKERRGLIRWGVTTIMTGVGTLFAIVWALTQGS